MASSDLLQNYIRECFEDLYNRPDGELLPWRRLTIYRYLAANDASISRSRPCQYLSMVSAEKVSDVWYRDTPQDEFLGLILADTRTAWHARRPARRLQHHWEDYLAYLEELATTPFGSLPGFPAGIAALIAFSHVFGRTFLDRCTWTLTTTEDELDFWSSDASLYAAIARSGRISDEGFDRETRVAFWESWLSEASSAHQHRRRR